MFAICSTHGLVEARVTVYGALVELHCQCGLLADPVIGEEEEDNEQQAQES